MSGLENDAALAKLDRLTDAWVEDAGWRDQLNLLCDMSLGFAGPRLKQSGGAELRMLILRQRSMIDRWVRQAYLEGLVNGEKSK